VPLFRKEVLGYEPLKRLAEEVYAGKNPLDHFYSGELYRLEKKDGAYRLLLKLPFASKEDIVLNTFAGELSIRLGGYKRLIPLPRPVAGARSIRAKMDGDILQITFEGEKNA
jgi:arsenite-transporting ATPase